MKADIEGPYLNIIKAMYDKHTVNIILSGEKLKAFPLRSETRVPTLATIIQYSLGSPCYIHQRSKRNKRIQIGNKEVKFSLLADDMTLYIENPKDATRKLLEIINEYRKLAGYKINRNPLHSQTLTMKNQKEKLRKQSHSPLQ